MILLNCQLFTQLDRNLSICISCLFLNVHWKLGNLYFHFNFNLNHCLFKPQNKKNRTIKINCCLKENYYSLKTQSIPHEEEKIIILTQKRLFKEDQEILKKGRKYL